MVTLTIDGKAIAAEAGLTVLQAASDAGIHIPTLCSHESLSPYGACRFCMVEVSQRGRHRLVTSCTLPVAEGMDVQTRSERVLRIRRVLAELMLARCPESTVIRDLAGELGVTASRMRPLTDVVSTIVSQSGCILCGMCVRLCDDVLKIGALAFEGRGARRRVTTPFRQPSDACLTCGACSSICPTHAIEHLRIRPHAPRPIPSEFEYGMTGRKPIYIPFPQAVPRVPVIDQSTCLYFKTGGCKVCEDNCGARAIDHAQQDQIRQLQVGTAVIATGFSLFDGGQMPRYGYGRYKNVFSALEFERLCHAGGPTGGRILTREGEPPASVAILHCIGSRDENHLRYCSRVCCMYSLKFAHLVKEKTGAEVYNLYIDVRASGKGYEEFYKRVLGEDVQFIRGKAAEVTDVAESPEERGKLIVVCEDTLLGLVRRIAVDMVILSSGLRPAEGAEKVAQAFALSCSRGEFFLERHPKLAPVDTASDGIFLAGACQGPKDIPDSVAQGGAAAAAALVLMDRGRFVLEPVTAEINAELCAGCKMCIANCPYTAIRYDPEQKVSVVTVELCKGCGTCVGGCPSGAARQDNFEDVQIFAEIKGALAPA